ncbi:protein eva-1 homolog C-like isoform X2 [Dunckerocampus dactyliophorus]|uniref:protein eva-1 homolog C-like isoform X2 n=1 Tax=Dunckerocampus dactyliophorus TaxID=161453 RepID=UPI0024053DF0|nr:protein eva-1 homolog C-like isoform X2 [Dunckerocampus dactyliophorus]
MCENINKVNSWLCAAFGDQAVPQYEVNSRTVDILYQLAQASETRCSDTKLLIEDLNQKAAEYQAEGAHLQDVLLQGVGLSYASLPKSCEVYLSALVDSAMVLGVRDTSLCSFMPALNRLTDELLDAEKSKRKVDRKVVAMRQRLSATLVLRSKLQEDLNKIAESQAVESAKAEERLLSMDFVKAKAKELRTRRERQEAQLASRNMDKSLTHEALVELSEEVTTLKQEMMPLKKKLEPYMDLSPNPSLAQVKIEEAKRELAALDSKLEMNMTFKRAMGHGPDLFYLTLLLWTRRGNGLADFSNYLSRILSSHSVYACDGHPLRLHCPRHSTISIHNAFYGSGLLARGCPAEHPPVVVARDRSCSSLTVLQKLLSECQNHRDCQLYVNHLLFGPDPCPGTRKYLHVDYMCKPTEHKRRVACEGEAMVLRCKPPRVLNIYAAVYGRGLHQADTCPSILSPDPPFDCLSYDAVQVLNKRCYSKQRCAVTVSNKTFKDPCSPGTRKYLSVLFSCVPWTLLREVDPNILITTSSPTASTEKGFPVDVDIPHSRGKDNPGAMMSTSLVTFTFIKEHRDMAALLFTSSVCVGLVVTLLAVSVRVTCGGRRHMGRRLQEDEDGEEEEDDDDDNTEGSSLVERKAVYYDWEDVTYVSEAAERAERIERREMIVQEIWMNAYLNGGSCL